MNPMLPVIDTAADKWLIDGYVNSDATLAFRPARRNRQSPIDCELQKLGLSARWAPRR
jgi:hypothetical protein